MSTVGVIVNPLAGKDIRRLVSHAGHTSDAAKVGIVRRIVVGAVEAGALRLMLSDDANRLCARALDGLDLAPHVLVEYIDGPNTRSRLDTIAAARELCKQQAGAVVVLGGDGTIRDAAIGWPDMPLVALATGTNNVFPGHSEATAAGSAAGFVATGAISLAESAQRSKRISVQIVDDDGTADDLALVEIGIIDTAFVGARAVRDVASIRAVIATIAGPATTGLSAVVGRVQPIGRFEPGGVVAVLSRPGSSCERSVRVPLSPGRFDTIPLQSVRRLASGESIRFEGPCVVAFDGERDRSVGAGGSVTATVELCGPHLIDVDKTLAIAVGRGLFDSAPPSLKGSHGD